MTESDRKHLISLWARLTEKPFDAYALVTQIHHDGGIDAANLSDHDIISLFNGTFSGDWHEPGFTFSEMLARYSVDRDGIYRERTVAWVFSVLTLADAIECHAADVDLNLNSFIDGYFLVRKQLDTDDTLWIFRRLFRSGDKAIEND